MTIESEPSFTLDPAGTATTGGQTSTPDPKQVAAAAKTETAAVAHTAVEGGKGVAQEAATQASAVAGQAKEQLYTVVGQAKGELKTQVDSKTQQAAAGLQTLASQLTALTQGRPEEAGHVATLIGDAQHRVQSYAQTLEQRGPQALLDDVASFARRKPGMFLLAATVTGFAVGRMVRAGAAANSEQTGGQQDYSQGYSQGYQGYSATGEMYGAPLTTPPATAPLYTDPVPYEGYADPAMTDIDLGVR